jgi:hypothetical protein
MQRSPYLRCRRLVATPATKPRNQVLALNRRVQAQNRAPEEFPGFVRQGFDILIVADGFSETPNGWARGRFSGGAADFWGGGVA